MTLSRPVAILTGGSSGIGKAIVDVLGADGFFLFILDKKPPDLPPDFPAMFFPVELSDREQIQRTVLQIQEKTASVEALIHCAGVYPSVRLGSYSPELWDLCLDVNVTAPFLLTQELLPLLRAAQASTIVTITSGAAYLGSRDPGYSASKAALVGLTKSLAKNLAPDNITVNAVSPGPIDTPMSQAGMRPEDVTVYLKNIPMQRFGTAQEVAQAVSYLVSKKARYLTGTTIHVNGGLYMS